MAIACSSSKHELSASTTPDGVQQWKDQNALRPFIDELESPTNVTANSCGAQNKVDSINCLVGPLNAGRHDRCDIGQRSFNNHTNASFSPDQGASKAQFQPHHL